MKLKTKNVDKWMPCPQTATDYPGLAYLYPLNEIILTKKLDALHEIIGKSDACYTIYNKDGEKIFVGVQQKNCKKCLVKIFNNYGNEVIEIKKPFAFFSQRVIVLAPPGNFVGCIDRKCTNYNTFLVENKHGEVVLKIKAQSTCSNVYDVLSGDELVGHIRKWTVTTVTNYNLGVSFPTQLDVTDKAVLLGACFLIGYLKY